ncbi:MAG: alpha-glucan family phosphorylase [Phycisphaeraceae bacterium]|nr:MAG: alpha-glucan family phosphorylase [Phycisphaeraceae bacterium]
MIAYFSMEIGIEQRIHTYCGGLGMLAGDSIRSAADLGLAMTAVTLASRRGYFRQMLDKSGRQTEAPAPWPIEELTEETPARAVVRIEERDVHIRAWRRDVVGVGGAVVPLLFLDTDLPDNHPDDRRLTDQLYGGDDAYRLKQEAILGIGGVRILRALGHHDIHRFHMNEGHSSLLAAELLLERMRAEGKDEIDTRTIAEVRTHCVFTTHTPVPAGHDRFPRNMVRKILGRHEAFEQSGLFDHENKLNMTYAGFNLSRYINGVAKKHGEISRRMFSGFTIDSITNGVHLGTWVSKPFAELFDRYMSGWRADNLSLRCGLSIPHAEVWEAHTSAKGTLLERIEADTGVKLSADALTLGYARRMTAYKRPLLIFNDLKRLRRIAEQIGPIQIVFAGKAHPRDDDGKAMIEKIHSAIAELRGEVDCVYLPEYDMELGALMTAGVDVWLNTPEPPLEASGTSGMKAAANGVPSLSVLDGWWVEGCIEGVTGWAIGGHNNDIDHDRDATLLYEKLEEAVLPAFYNDRHAFIDIMRHAIALNGSFFNTERMMRQYVVKAYFG